MIASVFIVKPASSTHAKGPNRRTALSPNRQL
jgi:hypothetical protein